MGSENGVKKMGSGLESCTPCCNADSHTRLTRLDTQKKWGQVLNLAPSCNADSHTRLTRLDTHTPLTGLATVP
jgi:hypothetical protein